MCKLWITSGLNGTQKRRFHEVGRLFFLLLIIESKCFVGSALNGVRYFLLLDVYVVVAYN